MKLSIRTTFLLLIGTFGTLFLFRLSYGYITHPTAGAVVEHVAGESSASFDYGRKNYASAKGGVEKSGGGNTIPLGVDQKYEKIGTISAKSRAFETDETLLRKAVASVGGLIQFEQSSGLEGRRSLHLAIGVVPEQFDTLIAELKTVGHLLTIRIDKLDKTNEYKTLQARRDSLEQTKNSLEALKSLGTGNIKELIDLELKISETEAQIQEMGVSLGDYDAENEFCTVKCSLLEVLANKPREIGMPQRIKVALDWTVSIYVRLSFVGLFGTLTLWSMFALASQISRRISVEVKERLKEWIGWTRFKR